MQKWDKNIRNVGKLPLLGLMIIIFVSSIFLVVINYYTLKTMSSVRAYINGESNYSKGEKDASQSLISFIQTADSTYWINFIDQIGIPQGDRVARVGLLNESETSIIREGFLRGKNHADDVDDMIWLFQTFKNMPLMAGPIAVWENGDSLISQKYAIANQIKLSIEEGTIEEHKLAFLASLEKNRNALTIKEIEFSESMGAVAREIRDYLLYANTIIILFILGSFSFYVLTMLRRLNSHNQALARANEELDKLSYSVSHDLRAPINSMLGLVNLAKGEKNLEKLDTYLDMMNKALVRQERFIKEMIAVTKENKKMLRLEIVDLDHLIEQVINLHKHMAGAEGIEFLMSIGVHKVFSDAHRLEIILNNLVSNAIKYHDQSKSNKQIAIKTRSENDKVYIDVVDNGLGIDGKDKSKIFEMYYMSKDREKGSGLGLFIVKEAIAKLGGEIKVESSKGNGSTFSVILKK